MRRCPKCGRLISANSTSCRYCDSPGDPVGKEQSRQGEGRRVIRVRKEKLKIPPIIPQELRKPPRIKTHEEASGADQIYQPEVTEEQTYQEESAGVQTTPEEISDDQSYPPEIFEEQVTPPEVSYKNVTPPEIPEEEIYREEQPYERSYYPREKSQLEQSTPPEKSKAGVIVLIITIVVVIAGAIIAFVLTEGRQSESGSSDGDQKIETYSDSLETQENADSTDEEEDEYEEDDDEIGPPSVDTNIYAADPGKYSIHTIISGYPAIIELEIDDHGNVWGRYAYESTLKKNGNKSSSWISLSGSGRGDRIFMESSHPDYGVFENWDVTLSGTKSSPRLSGIMSNYNLDEIYYVGSSRTKESINKPDEYLTDEDFGGD